MFEGMSSDSGENGKRWPVKYSFVLSCCPSLSLRKVRSFPALADGSVRLMCLPILTRNQNGTFCPLEEASRRSGGWTLEVVSSDSTCKRCCMNDHSFLPVIVGVTEEGSSSGRGEWAGGGVDNSSLCPHV